MLNFSIKNVLSLICCFGIAQNISADEMADAACCTVESVECVECKPQECCSNDFLVKATLLYLKPSTDQTSYAITSTNNRFGGEIYPDGKRHLLSYEYKPAWRLEGLYKLNETNLVDLSFTYFNSHHSDSVTGDFLFDTVGYPGHGAQAPEDTSYAGTAKIRQHFKYYLGEATLNRLAFDCTSDNITFLFGLQYLYLNFKQKFTGSGTFINNAAPTAVNNRFHQKSSFWGIGPEIGVAYNYVLQMNNCPGQWALNAKATGALLCSSTHAKLHYNSVRTGPVGVNLKNDPLWRLTPSLNAQLGVTYIGSFFEKDVEIELGYDFLWCSKCIDKITSYDVAFAGDTLDSLENLSLQGPFITVGVSF